MKLRRAGCRTPRSLPLNAVMPALPATAAPTAAIADASIRCGPEAEFSLCLPYVRFGSEAAIGNLEL